MNNMQKICYSMLLVVINSIGMEKPPIQSDKKQTKQDSLSQRLPNNFVQLLPVALTRSLSPFFSTPGPDQRTVTALGEIRARDNRADIIIEANKNMQQFQQFCQEQYGINPTDEHTDVRTFLEAQTAFLAAHPEEKSFYLSDGISSAFALDKKSSGGFLSDMLAQKIESFKKRSQVEKNKTAIDCMRHFPMPAIIGKLLDAGVDVDAYDPNTKFTLVRYAVEARSPVLLQDLVKRGASVNRADCRRITPLMRVVTMGEVELAKFLLNNNCRVNDIDEKGRSALCFAARRGDSEMVEILQSHGAHIFATSNSYRRNALVQAVKSGSVGTLRKLIDSCEPQIGQHAALGVFVNLALRQAAMIGSEAMVTELLPSDETPHLDFKRSPRPDMILDLEKRHQTALSCSIEAGHPKIALKLLDYAHDQYYKGLPNIAYARSYALALAVHKKFQNRRQLRVYQQVIDTLLEEEVDPLQATFCSSAAVLAAKNDDSILLKQLIKHAALQRYLHKQKNLDEQTIDEKELRNIEKNSAGELLLIAAQAGIAKAIKLLLDCGADASIVDKNGNTPLHKAVVVADKHTIGMVADLCEYYGLDCNKTNKDGDTPLHCALKNPDAEIKERVVKILLEHDADPNPVNMAGNTPLIVAAKMDSPLVGVIDVLLQGLADKKIKPDTQNKRGETALLCATAKGKSHIDIVERLLRQADPNLKNNSRCGALTKAAKVGSIEMTEILENAGANLDEFIDGMFREAAKKGHVEYMRYLKKKNPDLNLNSHSSSLGDTPLHKAVRGQKEKAVEFLLKLGADRSVKNFKGETSVDYAAVGKNGKIYDILLMHN